MYRYDQEGGQLERVFIEDLQVGNKVLSFDEATGQAFTDDVILLNKHEGHHGVCETVRFYFEKDSKVFLELEKHHFAWVQQEDGACTEKEASQV